ncbi:uncharacterized protein TNCV_4037301 [Trichonephila clavipes]|nr:uncharacterized protein TNCV_4037301 [Trichonephila clavipes]
MGHERKRRQKKRKFHGNFRTAQKKTCTEESCSRLRKLKKSTKGLGGKGKLTDKFIDTLQNDFGIAIRSNVGNLSNMQTAVIAAFFALLLHRQNPCMGNALLDPIHGVNTKRPSKKKTV